VQILHSSPWSFDILVTALQVLLSTRQFLFELGSDLFDFLHIVTHSDISIDKLICRDDFLNNFPLGTVNNLLRDDCLMRRGLSWINLFIFLILLFFSHLYGSSRDISRVYMWSVCELFGRDWGHRLSVKVDINEGSSIKDELWNIFLFIRYSYLDEHLNFLPSGIQDLDSQNVVPIEPKRPIDTAGFWVKTKLWR
jgi:hypothetical protein